MPRLLPGPDRNLRSSGFLRPVRLVERHDDPPLLPVTDHQIVQIEQTVRYDDFLLRFGIGFRGGSNHLTGRRSGKPLPAGPNRSIVPGSRRFVGLPFHRSILPRKTGRHRYRDRDSYRLRCRCRFRYRHGFRGRFVGKHRIRLGHRSRRNDKYRFRLRFCNGRCRNRLHGGRRFRHSSRLPDGCIQSFGHRSRLRQEIADRLRQQIVQVDTYFGHRRNFGDGLLRSDGRGSGGIPFVEIRKPYRFIQFLSLSKTKSRSMPGTSCEPAQPSTSSIKRASSSCILFTSITKSVYQSQRYEKYRMRETVCPQIAKNSPMQLDDYFPNRKNYVYLCFGCKTERKTFERTPHPLCCIYPH